MAQMGRAVVAIVIVYGIYAKKPMIFKGVPFQSLHDHRYQSL